MRRILVWDLPVRLFHWLLAASFLGAFAIATTASDEGALFPLHALLGIAAVVLVVLRLLWGIVGTRPARLTALDLRPGALADYLRGAFSGARRATPAGHNPATSWFMVALFAGLLGLGVTGYTLGQGSERFEDLHEGLAWFVLALVVAHVAGLAWHLLRRRENLAGGMVTGRKVVEAGQEIASARPAAAVALLALVAAIGVLLAAGFDPATRRLTLPLTDASLTLGEVEEGGGGQGSDRFVDEDDKGNEDDDD